MDTRIEIKYDRKIFQGVNRRLWWRSTSLVYQYGLSPLWIGVIVGVLFYGKGTILEWIGLAMSVMILLQPLASYILFMRRGRRTFTEPGSDKMIYHLTDDFIAVEHSIGRGEIFWKGIYTMIKFPQAWVLEFPKNLNIILPLRDTDDEVTKFIESKLQERIDALPPKPGIPQSS